MENNRIYFKTKDSNIVIINDDFLTTSLIPEESVDLIRKNSYIIPAITGSGDYYGQKACDHAAKLQKKNEQRAITSS